MLKKDDSYLHVLFKSSLKLYQQLVIWGFVVCDGFSVFDGASGFQYNKGLYASASFLLYKFVKVLSNVVFPLSTDSTTKCNYLCYVVTPARESARFWILENVNTSWTSVCFVTVLNRFWFRHDSYINIFLLSKKRVPLTQILIFSLDVRMFVSRFSDKLYFWF